MQTSQVYLVEGDFELLIILRLHLQCRGESGITTAGFCGSEDGIQSWRLWVIALLTSHTSLPGILDLEEEAVSGAKVAMPQPPCLGPDGVLGSQVGLQHSTCHACFF